MVLKNGISVTADGVSPNGGTKVIYSKIVGGKILEIRKEVKNCEKMLFWSAIYSTMSDLEWVSLQ